MSDAIARKLYQFGVLNAEDTAALARLADPEEAYTPHDDIVKIGSKPEFALAILAGWAIRYIVLKNGSRQITAFFDARGFLSPKHPVTGIDGSQHRSPFPRHGCTHQAW